MSSVGSFHPKTGTTDLCLTIKQPRKCRPERHFLSPEPKKTQKGNVSRSVCDELKSVCWGETLSSTYTFVLTLMTRLINHGVWLLSSGRGQRGGAGHQLSED